MLDLKKVKIVKRGILLYDNIAEYEVIVTESDILYGTGDYEDEPEIANDRECRCYYAWCDSPSGRGNFSTGMFLYAPGAFMSLEEAVLAIEGLDYFVRWKNIFGR